jgi:membrane associated rhomboid family serine protease
MFVSILIGGVIFALLENNEVLFVGSSTLTWGVSGAAITIGYRTWREAPMIAKIITIILSLVFILLILQLIVDNSISLIIAHISCAAIGVFYGFNKLKEQFFWIKETEPSIKSNEVA